MTGEEWKQVREIVGRALELPQGERSAFLDKAYADNPAIRQEVDSLLAMENTAKDFIEEPAVAWPTDNALGPQYDRIGPYKVLGEIGRGGMARVFEAERDDEMKMRVAVKVMTSRPGAQEEVNWRFRHERRILASLDHPHIAKVFDGGTTEDGLPYFVMERVKGERLDKYCETHKLSTRERVTLFLKVCSAVQYAHRKLVVHRDLKPGNILVTHDGEPKLLDFGIAKVLDFGEGGSPYGTTLPKTQPGIQPMTLGYASPEQFSGDAVTTATDVYSLGVVLYELLTGHNPHRISEPVYEQFRRAALESTPTKPSEIIAQSEALWTSQKTTIELTPEYVTRTREKNLQDLKRHLVGDLDCILLKALRKEPEQRYGSCTELSEDLDCYLKGFPVQARRGDFSYRALKFIHRNSWQLIATALLLFMLCGAVWYSWQVAKLKERNEAIEETLIYAIVLSSKEGGLSANLTSLRSGDVENILFRVNDLARSLEKQKRDYKTAGQVYRTVLDMKIEQFGETDNSVAVGMNNLAANLAAQGKFSEAEKLYLRSLEIKELNHGRETRDFLIGMINLVTLYQDTGRLTKATLQLEQFEEIALRSLDEEDDLWLYLQNTQAFQNQLQGRYSEAERMYRDVLPAVRARLPQWETRVLRNLAETLRAQGKLKAAEALARKTVEMNRDQLIDSSTADAESVLGGCLLDMGRHDDAGDLLARSYQTLRENRGENARLTREAKARLLAWEEATGN